jgi:hypothetical protein
MRLRLIIVLIPPSVSSLLLDNWLVFLRVRISGVLSPIDGEDDLSGVGIDDGSGCGKERMSQNDWSILTSPSLGNNEVGSHIGASYPQTYIV